MPNNWMQILNRAGVSLLCYFDDDKSCRLLKELSQAHRSVSTTYRCISVRYGRITASEVTKSRSMKFHPERNTSLFVGF